jgi:hypothetical protein
MPKVPDDKFPNSEVLDKLTCIGSDRILIKKPETLSIIEICQDPQNTSIGIVTFKLTGVLEFTPVLEVTRLDGELLKLPIKIPLYVGHKDSDEIPLDTKCDKKTIFKLAYDFGSPINTFLNVNKLSILFSMKGVLKRNLHLPRFKKGLNETIKTEYTWAKGPTPNPIGYQWDKVNKRFIIIFQLGEGYPCSCEMTCRTLSSDNTKFTYCEDKISRIIVDYDPKSDPLSYLFKFFDSLGNTTKLELNPVSGITPATPTAGLKTPLNRGVIGIIYKSKSGKDLDNIKAYQIWRYEGSENTAKILADWDYRDTNMYFDDTILPGKVYGYRVRLMGNYGDISEFSSWATITVS